VLSVGCNEPGQNGTKGTPCEGYQSMVEQRAQFALWCMLASPLILGHDVTRMGDEVRTIITNAEMIALNQDKLGLRARIVYQSDTIERTITIYVKKLADATSPRAAAVFNRGELTVNVTLTRAQMGFDEAQCACVHLRDVELHADVATAVRSAVLVVLQVQPHEARVIRARCC
jgi:alpha-galactosidase